ncbi:hypothetical protein BGZ63DRAFT_165865 [Mariannaea sp. PMI_226]|nr:hypothetical protein BGZ63DRAFT_165865 [Mariannaea sp. PMI_226]
MLALLLLIIRNKALSCCSNRMQDGSQGRSWSSSPESQPINNSSIRQFPSKGTIFIPSTICRYVVN